MMYLMQTYTGDIIVQSSASAIKAVQRAGQRRSGGDRSSARVPELGAIEIPPPVFFCGIEPTSAAQQKGKKKVLDRVL